MGKNSFKSLKRKALKELQKVNRPIFFSKEIHVSISKQRLTFRQSSYNIHLKKNVVSDNESEVCDEQETDDFQWDVGNDGNDDSQRDFRRIGMP